MTKLYLIWLEGKSMLPSVRSFQNYCVKCLIITRAFQNHKDVNDINDAPVCSAQPELPKGAALQRRWRNK